MAPTTTTYGRYCRKVAQWCATTPHVKARCAWCVVVSTTQRVGAAALRRGERTRRGPRRYGPSSYGGGGGGSSPASSKPSHSPHASAHHQPPRGHRSLQRGGACRAWRAWSRGRRTHTAARANVTSPRSAAAVVARSRRTPSSAHSPLSEQRSSDGGRTTLSAACNRAHESRGNHGRANNWRPSGSLMDKARLLTCPRAKSSWTLAASPAPASSAPSAPWRANGG